MKRAIVLGAGLAAGVVAAGAFLLLGDEGLETPLRLGDRAAVADAVVAPRQHLFGDVVSARVDVILDRRRVDPAGVSLRSTYEPYRPTAPVRTSRLDVGEVTRIRFAMELRCVDEACVPLTSGQPFSFRRGVVLADGERIAGFEWPEIAMKSRVTRTGEERDAPAGTWRVSATDPPAPTFRVSPGVAVALLAGLAGVLVATGIALLGMALRPAEAAEPPLPPLERALILLETARQRPEPQEERKALDLLAVELSRYGEPDLARAARELAWARVRPASEATDRLSERVGELVASRNGRHA